MRTIKEILNLIEEEDIKFIRLQFTDMYGNLKNIAVTSNQLERVLHNKYMFENQQLFGMGKEGEDMYLCPDLDTFVILPWRPQQGKVARLICDVYNADGTISDLYPRTILKEIIQSAKEKGYTFYVDPECEFFLFDTDDNGVPTTVTHEKAGYMEVGPVDSGENVRRDIVLMLEEMGFEMESSHHEKAPAQHEIDFREGEALQIADSVITFKSAVRSIAKRFGLHATFMPKPKHGVAGSAMHLNISVYKDGKCLFNSKGGELRDETKWFIGGILKHVKGMCAVTNPLVNSYKRLQSGYCAPNSISWSYRDVNAIVKVRRSIGEDTKVELRFPDPSANPYLAIALCIAAGIDGLEHQINPGDMLENCREKGLPVGSLPSTLREAIHHMKNDELIENVLGKEFVRAYMNGKIREWNEYMAQVSDWEVEKYLHCV